jgi:aryl-alcohol dehydrogenase-like predicted oxidoreductase
LENAAMMMRRLGSNGPELSAIGLGCMGMSAFYGGRDAAESQRTLNRAVELGVTLFDTADVYGQGANEELVGRVLKPVRKRVFIATKFGNTWGPNGERTGISGRPDYVRAACDASLKRLGLDVIDLYYQHRVDPQTPIEDTVGAMADLVRAGKVRFLGLSEAAPATIRRAHAVHPITALQTEFSLWSRDPEAEIIPVLRELGIGFVPYSPLGRGFLTGQIRSPEDLDADDWRRTSPRFQGAAFQSNLKLVERIGEIAAEKNCTPGQLALAWVLAQGDHIIPIPGTKKVRYLEENVAAASLSLSDAELAAIDRALPVGAVTGDRYAPEAMRALNL